MTVFRNAPSCGTCPAAFS